MVEDPVARSLRTHQTSGRRLRRLSNMRWRALCARTRQGACGANQEARGVGARAARALAGAPAAPVRRRALARCARELDGAPAAPRGVGARCARALARAPAAPVKRRALRAHQVGRLRRLGGGTRCARPTGKAPAPAAPRRRRALRARKPPDTSKPAGEGRKGRVQLPVNRQSRPKSDPYSPSPFLHTCRV